MSWPRPSSISLSCPSLMSWPLSSYDIIIWSFIASGAPLLFDVTIHSVGLGRSETCLFSISPVSWLWILLHATCYCLDVCASGTNSNIQDSVRVDINSNHVAANIQHLFLTRPNSWEETNKREAKQGRSQSSNRIYEYSCIYTHITLIFETLFRDRKQGKQPQEAKWNKNEGSPKVPWRCRR